MEGVKEGVLLRDSGGGEGVIEGVGVAVMEAVGVTVGVTDVVELGVEVEVREAPAEKVGVEEREGVVEGVGVAETVGVGEVVEEEVGKGGCQMRMLPVMPLNWVTESVENLMVIWLVVVV